MEGKFIGLRLVDRNGSVSMFINLYLGADAALLKSPLSDYTDQTDSHVIPNVREEGEGG